MVNTRNRVAANNAENNGESNNQEANPLPPPPLTLEQVLAMQVQMFHTMQQTLVNQHAQPQASPPPRDRLGDFQRTKPPTFLMIWTQWMLMIGSNLLRRSCKWYSATIMRGWTGILC
jgi:hypothetical protein